MKKITIVLGISLSGLLLFQCNNTDQAIVNEVVKQTLLVDPPLQNVNLNFNSFTVTADKETVLEIESGSKITIPENAFVDANGNPITKPVKIEYREFHSLGEIISSGISMNYDSAGSTKYFESAGMFEMNGMCDGQDVYVAEGKEIKVDMVSTKDGSEYNFYKLDQDANNWSYKGTSSGEVDIEAEAEKMANELLDELAEETELEKPFLPKKYDGTGYVFDLNVNYWAFPELKPFKSVIWRYAGGDDKNPENDDEFTSNTWSDVNLEAYNAEDGVYKIVLSDGKKKYTALAEPVLSEHNYDKALADFNQKMEAYKVNLENKKLEAERKEQEDMLVRSFNLKGFGIYNWDRVCTLDDPIIVSAEFDYGKEVDTDMNKVNIFLLAGKSGEVVVRYDPLTVKNFSFVPEENNKLIAILPGNQVAYCGNNEFAKVDKSNRKSTNPGSHKFKLRLSDKKISSPQDLDKILVEI